MKSWRVKQISSKEAYIQSLANHRLVVDALYRLISLPLPFNFEQEVNAGLMTLRPKDLLSPYNALAILHFQVSVLEAIITRYEPTIPYGEPATSHRPREKESLASQACQRGEGGGPAGCRRRV